MKSNQPSATKRIFPYKLWSMVNDRNFESAVMWSRDGRSFLVFENELKNLCLGKENQFFYTKKPKSFVRQLHLYGFRKITKNQFSHPSFLRGRPDLLQNIRRAYKRTTNEPVNRPESCSESTVSFTSFDTSTTPALILTNEHQLCPISPIEQTTTSTDTPNQFVSLEPLTLQSELQEIEPGPINCLASIESPADYGNSNCTPQINWPETSFNEVDYNYNDYNVLTLYNSDIYQNTNNDINLRL